MSHNKTLGALQCIDPLLALIIDPVICKLTKDYSKDFTTGQLLTIGHMAMFVVKSIVIQIRFMDLSK